MDLGGASARRDARVHLVLFASEGPPHDSGIPLIHEAELLRDRAQESFHSVQIATPRELRLRDISWEPLLADYRGWVETQADYSPELRWNRSWAAIGFQAWKPRLILERLHAEDVMEGDIVFYHDSNVTKYPRYLNGVNQWASLQIRRMRNASVLLYIDGVSDIRQDAKHELLNELLGPLDDGFIPTPMGGILAARRDHEGIRFVKEWADLSSNLRYLSPISRPPFDPRFIWHTPNQATLGGVWYSRIAAGDNDAIRVVNLRGRRSIPPASFFSFSVLKYELATRAPGAFDVLSHARQAIRTLRLKSDPQEGR